jgi:hypothetical protein
MRSIYYFLIFIILLFHNAGCGGGSGEGTISDSKSFNNLFYKKTGHLLYLSWEFSESGDQIVIHRGSRPIAFLDADATNYFINQSFYGYFKFSVTLYSNGIPVERKQALIDIGKLVWNHSESRISGYCIYIAEAVGNPYDLLPYDNPIDYDYDVGYATSVSLKFMYDNSLIEDGKKYFIALSSYRNDKPETRFSDLTKPMGIMYSVETMGP